MNKNTNNKASIPSMVPYLLHLADSALILGHRNSEWCGHGPVLEQDIAITNISLDLLGQARYLYQHAAECLGEGHTEDTLAYLRSEREYRNWLLAEQPNGDWGQTILRQYFISQFQHLLYSDLKSRPYMPLAAIAEKALPEVAYHLRWSSEWVIRLGDGTAESHNRMLTAVDNLWPYVGELFRPADFEVILASESWIPDCSHLQAAWQVATNSLFEEAGLLLPEISYTQQGGKTGLHTEEMGYILAELQFMQRAYPDSQW